MANIRTIYEVSKPDQQFYSVERAGFTNVGDATFSVVNDALTQGAFTVANVNYKATNGATVGGEWPPLERIYTMTSPGQGYKVGDKLQLQGGNALVKMSITVDSIKTEKRSGVTYGGVISTYTLDDVGSYITVPGPAEDVPMEYVDPAYSTATFAVKGNLVSSVGGLPTPSIISTTASYTVPDWNIRFGSDGGGGTMGTRWPTTGAWCFTNDFDSDVKVGSLVTLDPDNSDGTSDIPENTIITSITTISGGAVTGATPIRSWQLQPIVEYTADITYFTFSNPVTISKNDVLVFKGTAAKFNNIVLQTPSEWTAILEAAGAIDPMNDTVGVYGNVAVTTDSSNQVQITNIVTSNSYNPVIYAGQNITMPGDTIGSSGNAIPTGVLVSSVENYTEVISGSKVFKANVKLSSNLSLEAGKRLQFDFGSPQPWRLAVQILKNTTSPASGPQIVNVFAATPLQLANDGKISKVYDSSGTHVDWAGLIGNKWTNGATKPSLTSTDQGFYNREKRVSQSPENYPLNYSLTLTNRGMFLGMWEGNWSTMQQAARTPGTDNYFNWFLIQRPVNRLTGQVVTTGRCPVFCVNGVGYRYWKFIVREEDVLHPTVGPADGRIEQADALTGAITVTTTPYRTPADYHSIDSFAILNTTNQISLTEDSKYLLSFINNLTTPRFRYSDELDMIGQTSADVVGQGVELEINAYNQTLPRYYRALPGNNKYNTGLRICVLKDIPSA